MKKAVAYLRVSGKAQVEGDGFPRQHDAIAKFAEKGGYNVVRVFQEDITGKAELEEREQLTALVEFIEREGIKTVLIERADRLARRVMVTELLLDGFRKLGVKVVTSDGQDLTADENDDPEAVMIRQIFAVFAQYEKSRIVLKLRAARRRQKKATGRCEGAKPFGELEGEGNTVHMMIEWRHQTVAGKRTSFREIASRLNAAGVPTRNGREWKPGTVAAIIGRVRPELSSSKAEE